MSKKYRRVKFLNNKRKGLGGALNIGISKSSCDYLVIFMADMSDDVNDLIKYHHDLIMSKNLDAVLGSRFIKKNSVKGYPLKTSF